MSERILKEAQARPNLDEETFFSYFENEEMQRQTILNLKSEILKYLPDNFPLYPSDKLIEYLDIDEQDIQKVFYRLTEENIYLRNQWIKRWIIDWNSFVDIAKAIDEYNNKYTSHNK